MRPSLACCLLLLAVVAAWTTPARADERILDYQSDIQVTADGGMTVTEHIKVRAEGRRIQRGIYRDYPTDYRDRLGNRYKVGFDVLDVQRDGHSEPWHTARRDNGVRVYIGNRHLTVSPGVHEYTLTYHTSRQIGFFANHDELYWNVTGTGWAFPIDHAGATVRLPVDVDPARLKAYGYTGAQGADGHALLARLTGDGATYATTRVLAAHQGLTLVLAFPKGLVRAPDARQKLLWLLQDNHNLLLGLLGLALLWFYYGLAWNRCGRDPASGPLVARYDPPGGDSAAALRYVRRMGYDNTCLTAGMLDLAARGCMDIEQTGRKEYRLDRKADAPVGSLRGDGKALFQALFAGGDSLALEQAERTRIIKARKAHERALSLTYEKNYFLTHTGTLLPGVLISLATLSALMYHASLTVIPIFLALIGTNIAFYHWMKAPTQLGARLLDGIEGFRWYLGVAEKQELDARYRPESHPELFARYLPYAVALDVGSAWGDRFANSLDAEQMRQAQPGWYHGTNAGLFAAGNLGAFSASVGAGVSSAIASASVAPGSSSGSGGFSGGGGGGGGGGGW